MLKTMSYRKNILISLVVAILVSHTSCVQEIGNSGDYHSLYLNFFAALKKNNPELAIDSLLCPPLIKKPEARAKAIAEVSKVSQDNGTVENFDIVKDVSISPHIEYVSGFAIYSDKNNFKCPIFYEFIFYKSQNSWFTLHMFFDLKSIGHAREAVGLGALTSGTSQK